MKKRSLPLGIDIGATRVRVAQAYEDAGGPRIHAMAVREVSAGIASSGAIADVAHVSALLEEAVAEIGTRDRRCICAIGEPDALLHPLRFPKMSSLERERAARFEASRHIPYPIEEAMVRILPAGADGSVWMMGIARKAAVITRCAAIRGAGLKPLAMDHESYALLRAVPAADAVLDIGYQRSSLHLPREEGPRTLQTLNGGADVTRAIERELSLDERTAEKRKRILGTAGAGERARAALVTDIAALIMQARQLRPIERIGVCGNGARLAGLIEDIEAAAHVVVGSPPAEAMRVGSYPEDVARSSAPDWMLATGLTLWRT